MPISVGKLFIGITIVMVLEGILLWCFILQLPLFIRDTLAVEIVRSIIATDGVLIGFAGLIATVLFTNPPYKGKDFLQATIGVAAASAGWFLVSIVCSIFIIGSMKLGLRGSDLFWPIMTLVLGVTGLFIFLGAVIGFVPLPEENMKTSSSQSVSSTLHL